VNILEIDILFFVAVALIFGFVGGKAVHYLRLPAVVGYLIMGLLFGPSFLNIFRPELLDKMNVFTNVALSLVAFIIGSQMRLETLREMGRGIGAIILSESLGAFLLVAAGVYLLTGQLYTALLFGAIAPASAPAGTVAVLEECKAKGRLTNALYAVVGLDDGLAIIIFAIAAALAELSFTGRVDSLAQALKGPVFEIIGSILLGGIAGVTTGYFVRKVPSEEGILAVSLGGILICTGIANYLHLSLILANLSLGMVFVNLFSVANRKAYRAIEYISLPIYIIFFFIAGARLEIRLLPAMGLLGLIYVVCRVVGLVGGAYFGARVTKQDPVIRKYLGFGILSQAGVAIGLAVLAAGRFDPLGQAGHNLAVLIVNIIAASTIVFEIIGPIGTKFAISRAGEAGVNVTVNDLINTYQVKDVMDSKVPVIPAGASLNDVIKVVSETDSSFYPVVNSDNKLIGALTLDGIRKTFATQELNDWLVALDITEPVTATVRPDMALSEAIEKAQQLDVEQLPVLTPGESEKLIGVLDIRGVHRRLHAEVLARQKAAGSI